MDKANLISRIQDLTSPIRPNRFDHPTQLNHLSGIKCVAFDFYGTMFISGVGDIGIDEEQHDAYEQVFEEALAYSDISVTHPAPGRTGLKEFKKTIDRHIQQKRAEGLDYPEPNIITVWNDVLATLGQLNFIKKPVTNDNVIRFAIEYEFRANTIWPVPNLKDILNTLLDRDLKLGIISNSQFYTPLAFEAFMGGSPDDFGFDPDLLKWSFEVGFKKPSVNFYRQFTGELAVKNIAPEEVLYVGNDLFKDIIPASTLNMRTALYVGDRRSVRHEKPDLTDLDNHPDIIIDDLHQVEQCLK